MKKKDLVTLRAVLEEEKKRIMRHLEDISDSSVVELDEGTGDSVDLAALEINQNSLQKLGKRELGHLKKIDVALKKMDDGTYGECENCGEEIAFARLMARPVAQLCIDCKTEEENEERKYSDRTEEEEYDSLPEETEDLS
jgi:DnaK suppressor protein